MCRCNAVSKCPLKVIIAWETAKCNYIFGTLLCALMNTTCALMWVHSFTLTHHYRALFSFYDYFVGCIQAWPCPNLSLYPTENVQKGWHSFHHACKLNTLSPTPPDCKPRLWHSFESFISFYAISSGDYYTNGIAFHVLLFRLTVVRNNNSPQMC